MTEQTLGRGLRLPFGSYTDVEILDGLEVLAHERYEQLLKRAGVINEQFVDRRTRAVLRKNAQGDLVSQVQTSEVSAPVAVAEGEEEAPATGEGQPVVSTVEKHQAKGEEELKALEIELAPRSDLPVLKVPRLKMTPVKSEFSLADITDFDPFTKLGERIAADPENHLRRTTVSARVVERADGLRRTELVTAPAIDKVVSEAPVLPFADLHAQLLQQLLASPVVPARAKEAAAARPIVDAFMRGLGDKDHAEELLSAYFDRAAASLIGAVAEQQRKVAPKPTYKEVVETVEFNASRHGKPEVSTARSGPYKRGVAYEYEKSLYAQDWFDSSTERSVANAIDQADEVEYFVRLQRNDLPILWAEGRDYNSDFIVVEKDGPHWVVEVKADKDMASETVQGKREAARRWANHVNADASAEKTWRYLLISETDVKTAKDSWTALKKLGT